MRIAPIAPDQHAAVVALWEATGLTRPWNDPRSDLARAVANSGSEVLVGTLDGVPVASAMVGDDGHRGWLYYVAVRPDLQGAGYGRSIVAAAETWLCDRGVRKVELMVRDGNDPATAFYRTIGYVRSDVAVLSRWLAEPAG